MRVLVVEDEMRLSEALGEILKQNQYSVDVVHDGESGLDYAMSGIYDVVVLDVMLPKMNGFDVVRHMRREKNKTPVLMLTAKDTIFDKVEGLDSGADYYLTKPFSTEELLACLRALTRRKGEVVMDELAFGDITLSFQTRSLHCGEKHVRLSMKEFEVMRLLMSNAQGVVSKEELIVKVWGMESEVEDNNVEVYVSFLRKKLFFIGSKVNIETVRKIGYHLEEQG